MGLGGKADIYNGVGELEIVQEYGHFDKGSWDIHNYRTLIKVSRLLPAIDRGWKAPYLQREF